MHPLASVRSPSVRPSLVYAGDIATTVAAADVAYGVCSIRPPQPTNDARSCKYEGINKKLINLWDGIACMLDVSINS